MPKAGRIIRKRAVKLPIVQAKIRYGNPGV